MVVTGIVRPAVGTIVPRRRGADGRDFGVRADGSTRSAATEATSGVAMTSLLALQEAESDRQQDQEARQHGEAVVEELTALQRMLLGADEPDLGRLAALVARPITASDPRLAGVLRAVRLRAGIELARRGCAASM